MAADLNHSPSHLAICIACRLVNIPYTVNKHLTNPQLVDFRFELLQGILSEILDFKVIRQLINPNIFRELIVIWRKSAYCHVPVFRLSDIPG